MTQQTQGIQSQGTQSQGSPLQETQTPVSRTLMPQTPVPTTLDVQPKEDASSQGAQPLSEALFEQLGEEYVQEGALSDASYETLKAQGIPRNVVDIYMQGLSAQVETMTRKVYDVVGGEESYRKAQDWAKKQWNPAQQEAFNKAIHSGDDSLVLLAVQGLAAQYQQTQGREPQLIQVSGNLGDPSRGVTTNLPDVFESTGQLMAAMKDPRYGQDEAYREQVKMALNNSRIL